MSEFIHRHQAGNAANRTLLLLHGTGGNEHSLMDLAEAVAPGWTRLGVRGRSLEEGSPRYFRRLAEGVLDEEDIVARARELEAFVSAAAQEYGFDPHGLFALGYSNGANMASAMLLLHPNTLAGGVMLRPMVPLRPSPLPDLKGKQALLVAGRYDTVTPPDNARAIADLLREAGADARLECVGGGHGLTTADVEMARQFFAQVLPG